jgi:hypothetical protein
MVDPNERAAPAGTEGGSENNYHTPINNIRRHTGQESRTDRLSLPVLGCDGHPAAHVGVVIRELARGSHV